MTGKMRARANGEGSIYPHRNGFAAYAWVTSPTLAEFLAYWLREVIAPNRAPLTASTYESLVRLYLVPGLGSKRLDRLSVRDVQTWMTGLRIACQCCAQGKDAHRPTDRRRCCAVGNCCRQVPSPRTIRDLRTVLRSALSTAQREELVTKNAAALVTVPSGRTRKTQAWTIDEARAFLESARADDDPHYALYVLVLVLGLRKGETLGLAWRDVNLDAGELAGPMASSAGTSRAASSRDQDRGLGRHAAAAGPVRDCAAPAGRTAGLRPRGCRRGLAGRR
jgi:integrase